MRDFVIGILGLEKELAWQAEICAVCPKCKAGKMPLENEGTGTSLVCPSCKHKELLKLDPDEITARVLTRMQQVHQARRPKPPTTRAPYT